MRSGDLEPFLDFEPQFLVGEPRDSAPKSKPFPATIFVDWLTHWVRALSSAALSNAALSVLFLAVVTPFDRSLIPCIGDEMGS